MYGIVNFGGFITACILLNMTPGVDTVYILSRSAAGGRRHGIASALGITTGIFVHTVLAALGLSAVLATSAAAFTAVKLLGAGYLVYLGIRALFSKEGVIQADREEKKQNVSAVYRQGILTNVLNPKAALFFLALLPQYVSGNAVSGPVPFLILGMVFMCTSTVWSLILATAAGALTAVLRRNEKVAERMNRAAGCVYIFLGLHVLRAKID